VTRRRVAFYGAGEESLALLPLLEANAELEVAFLFDDDRLGARERLAALDPHSSVERPSAWDAKVTDDPARFERESGLHAVIDAGRGPAFADRFPDVAARGVQIVSPLTARLLWAYGAQARDRKSELLQALHEIVESVNLTVDPDELFSRMLEIALGVTGADRGSLMLLDPVTKLLTVRVAVGLEPELWPKVRVRLGEGIAGRVAAEARSVRLRGKADRQAFQVVRERLDVESALSVPLVQNGRVLGVLNLHHGTRADVFSDADVAFVEELARLDAEIIAKAQEHASLRQQAQRYEAVGATRTLLAERTPLPERLTHLCHALAERAGGGIAHLYLFEPDEGALRLAATSLAGGGFAGEQRIALGEGIDGQAAGERRASFLRREGGLLGYASLPLVAGEELVGLISIQFGKDAPRGRGAEETFQEIAAAASDEIAQSEREARFAIRATKISALNESGMRMISTHDPGEVARLATSAATLLLDADHAVLRLRDDASGRFVIRAYFGPADGRQQEELFRLDRHVSLEAAKRRSVFSVRDLSAEPALRDVARGVRSALAAPLKRDGRPIGTLCVYDKVATDRFYPGAFNDDDQALYAKLVSMVERALSSALQHTHARQHRSFDEETGLPNASYLARRLDEEIARGSGRADAFALVICRIESFAALVQEGAPGQATRALRALADAMRGQLRDFDVLARWDDAELAALMPDPGRAPEERIATLARHVAEEVRKDERLNEPTPIALSFGYALATGLGDTRDGVIQRALVPRIRMV